MKKSTQPAARTVQTWSVYALKNHLGVVFYIGRGKGSDTKTVCSHLYALQALKHRGANPEREAAFRATWEAKKEVEVEILSSHDTEDKCCASQVELIAKERAINPNLTNRTIGGRGAPTIKTRRLSPMEQYNLRLESGEIEPHDPDAIKSLHVYKCWTTNEDHPFYIGSHVGVTEPETSDPERIQQSYAASRKTPISPLAKYVADLGHKNIPIRYTLIQSFTLPENEDAGRAKLAALKAEARLMGGLVE